MQIPLELLLPSDDSASDKQGRPNQLQQLTATQMKKKIVYLPPFLHYSYQNVPSRATATATATATVTATATIANVNGNFNANANRTVGTANAGDGGSCCRWELNQPQQQQQQQHKYYEKQQQQSHRQHQHQDNVIVKNIKKGRQQQRERHRNFHIQCVSVSNRQNVANNITSAAVTSPATITTSTARRRLPHPSPIHYSHRDRQQESSMMERDDSHQINDERTLKSNSHVDDKIINKLRNPQLIVMPIERECSRLDNAAAEWWYKTAMSTNWWWSDGPPKITDTNNSQTTTLQCRCFKKNGDILLKKDYGGNCETRQTTTSMSMYTANIGMEAANSITMARTSQATSAAVTTRTHSKISSQLTLRQLWQKTPLRSQVEKTFAASKWLLILVMLMLTNTADCWAGRQDSATNCTFPVRWEGSWFLSGYQQSIHIKGSEFSYRGKCAASDGNKYLIVDEKGCHRCLVIYEKHKNVLQYKENFCKGRETLQTLCDQIPGDALLYSLFRESAEPVKCPLKGPFIFTYNRGHGECKSPLSNIDSCTEDSRLLLSFQACPDVQGTESTVEELTCLATWKDGNSRYLVGLVSHHHAISNEERYRCFVYEKINPMMGGPSIITSKDAEYKLAQSGDATCNGLDSAEVGSRIMSLRKPPLTERCDFPVWFKGPRHWHALMGNALYSYHTNDGSIHIIKSSGYMETRALCEQINKQTSTEMMAVVHYTTGCQSGFMCMMFYRRDIHVIEIQTGKPAFRLEDACAPDHFDTTKLPYLTLLASNPDLQECPMEGLYNLRGAIGPPYMATRHKRNHNNNSNNKVHAGHGHHHLNEGGAGSGNGGGSVSGINSRTAYNQKRHSTLSFRNADRIETGVWHANTRGLQGRNRRAAAGTKAISESGAGAGAGAGARVEAGITNTISSSPTHSISSSSVSAADKSNIVESTAVPNTVAPASMAIPMAMAMDSDVDADADAAADADADADKTTNIIHENTTTSTVSNATSMHILTPTAYEHHHRHLTNSTKATRITGPAYESTALTARQRRRRNAPGCITNYKAQRQLWVGCKERSVIDVRPMCTDEGDEEYSCHGSWTENSTVYIIARHKGTKHGVCITYRPTEGTSAKLVIGDACYRSMQQQPPPEHHLVANLSIFGKCGETGSASQQIAIIGCWATLAVAISTNIILSALVFNHR